MIVVATALNNQLFSFNVWMLDCESLGRTRHRADLFFLVNAFGQDTHPLIVEAAFDRMEALINWEHPMLGDLVRGGFKGEVLTWYNDAYIKAAAFRDGGEKVERGSPKPTPSPGTTRG